MDIEVSLKIRSAIKAKLVELGCHVDEELPDYIMVLIANRRTRVQMEEDLFLFLGDNTSAFTVWLHHVLKKLEQITTTTGKVGLFAHGSASTIVNAADESTVEVPSLPPVVNEKPDHIEKSKGVKKRSKGDEKIDKKKLKITESKSSKKPSPTKIKINKTNFKESPRRNKASSSKDARDSSKPSKPANAAVGSVQSSDERISDPAPDDDVETSEDFSTREDEISTSSTTATAEIEPIFKVPTTVTATKKVKVLKRRSDKEPDEEDNDDEDCLSLKAEPDDLFLEPGANQGKLKAKIGKKAVASAPARTPDVDPEAEAEELELLRQKVIDSTRKKRSIMSRLGEPVTVKSEVPFVTRTVKSPARESNMKRRSETPPPVRSTSNSDESPSPVKENRDSAFSRIDRKKISTKNIENLNRIIKSNSEVKRESSKSETSSSRPRSPKPKKVEEVKERRKSSSSSRDRSPRRSRDRESVREKERSTHDRKRKADRELYTQHKQLKSSIGSIINRPRQRYEKDEEYDPSCPEVNNKLQSIVKIPERSSRKPSVMEPTNKKILFRAIADAEKSLLQTRQIKSKYEEKEKSMETESKNKKSTTRKSIHDRLGYIEKKEEKVVENMDEDEESIIVEEWEYEDDADVEGEVDDDLEMSSFNNYGGEETIIINIPNESNIGRNVMFESKDTDDSNAKTVQRKSDVYTGPISQPKRISIQVHTDDDDDDDDSSTTDDDNNNSDIERSASANDNVYRSEDSVPSNADMDSSNNEFDFILNESNTKLPSPDDQSERENSDTRFVDNNRNDLIQNTKKVVARSDSRIQITLNNDCASMSPTATAMGNLNPVKIFQQPTFPLQPQQSQIQSIHQIQTCKFWPNCTFSDKCMYSHPPCKFNTKCTKPNCPYKHIGFIKNTIPTTRQPHPKSLNSGRPYPGKLQGSTGVPAGGITVANNSVKTCKYFPKCHTMSCPYFHPTPCRFGTGCTDLKCKNYHPGVTAATKKFTTTTKNKMDLFKWKAPKQSTSTASTSAPNAS